MILPILAAALLSQTTPPIELSPEQKTADAFERLSVAAEKLAAAAERLSPPPPAEEKAPPAPPSAWSFYVNASLTSSTGNVSALSMVGAAGGMRKGEKTIFTFKVFGGYGQTFNDPVPPATEGTTAVLLYNAGGTAQFDYRFTDHVSAFVGTGIDTDHVKSVEVRGYGDLGVGVLWLDVKQDKVQKWFLKTDLNLRVQQEQRYQYYPAPLQLPDAFLLGPRLAASFRYSLSAGTYFTEDLELIPNVIGDDAGRLLFNSDTKLAVGIAANVSAIAGFGIKYDSKPAEGKKPLDTLLTVGIEATF